MQKKVLSFLLAGLLVMSLCIVGAPHVSAAQDMQASDACVELIKSFEGFSATVFYDYSQYSIGYGTACGQYDYPNGITEAEAEQLLRRELTKYEDSVNRFASEYGVSLNQAQFDALASFTYNLGPNWMNNASTFRSAVLNGSQGNDFIFAITQWCNAGGTILEGLVNRRMAEANLYLNGVYSKNLPSTYRYVLFNNNLEGAVSTIKIQGYDSSITDTLRANPTKSGYKFVGWYTEPSGGTCITRADANTPRTLYAHWQTDSGEDVSGGTLGHAVDYKVTVITDDVNIRKGPGTDYDKNGKAQAGQELQLTWVQPGGMYLWGQFNDGWICLDYTDYEAVLLERSPSADVVTAVGEVVDTDTLRVRARPTTASAEVGTYSKGDKMNITIQCKIGDMNWGKTDKGWIGLRYVKLTPVESSVEPPASEPTEPPADTPTEPSNEVIAKGKIVGTDSLRIREGAGTKYKQVGSLLRGAKVDLYEITGSGSQVWARMNKGWISMNYVELIDDDEQEEPADTPEQDSGSSQEPIVGYVVKCDQLNIRAGVGTKYSKVGKLAAGTRVTILETQKLGSTTWGRIDKGWISMDYIQLGEPENNSANNNSTTQKPVTGYVVKCDELNIRAGVGTKYDKVGKLPAGTKVTILETQKLGSTTWGRIDKGWISMDYVQLGEKAPSSSGSSSSVVTKAKSGTIINASEVNVRKEPGTSSKQVGTVKKGDKVIILETRQSGGATWGRTEKGWIHMHYVKLDSVSVTSEAVVRTVTADSLRIRSAPGTSNKEVGKYAKGTQVVILEQKKVGSATWGRTAKGWIHMHYVK